MAKSFWLVVVAAALLLLAGCGSATSASSTSFPPPRPPASLEASIGAVESSLATIPPIVFADPVGIDQSPESRPAVGSRPAASDYKPLLDSGHVASVQWVQTQLNGKVQPVLTLTLDQYGTAVIARWTSEHRGDSLLTLVDGRYLAMSTVVEPITTGSLQLTGANDSGMRGLLESSSARNP